jgi:hypothetical protein
MEFSLHLPINSVSFGQVSLAILREIYRRGLNPYLLPIGNVDLSTSKEDQEFNNWLVKCINSFKTSHNRDIPVIKLWHLVNGYESISKKQILLSFYELDSPTELEKNVAKSNITVFTNRYTQEVFSNQGIETHFIPLGFDTYNFKRLEKQFFSDGRITFNLCGKLERRKNHVRVIKSWLKKFGNDKRYSLQIACYNSFLTKEINDKIINDTLEGRRYFNFNNLERVPSNDDYNEFLNSADVIIGMSSGEGWGIPEFSSTAMGKHAIILNAHAYQTWANEKNSVLVNPLDQKIDCYDNVFFKKGTDVNQGQYFNYKEDDFISACEEVIKRVESNRTNLEGLKLQEEFTYSKTVDSLLELVK